MNIYKSISISALTAVAIIISPCKKATAQSGIGNNGNITAIQGIKEDILYKSIRELKELYDNGEYQAVITLSSTLKGKMETGGYKRCLNPDISEIEGYAVMSAVKLKRENAEGLISEFEGKYPYSQMVTRIKLVQADLYFSDNDYANSYKHFTGISPETLNIRDLDEYYFKTGFSAMQIGRENSAVSCFSKVYSSSNPTLRNGAYYYTGYIHYRDKNFKEAIRFLEKVSNDQKYAKLAAAQLLECHLMLKDYNFVINNGDKIYNSVDDNSKPKIARMISEAYYATNNPQKAKYYFELFSVANGSLSYNDIFYSGITSYNVGEYINAIDSFSKVASTKDSIGQSAYYHLGESFIKVKNKRGAQEAFKNASLSNFDKSVQEDASFNYAKLSFDLDRNMSPFNDYLKRYSCTQDKKEEIYNYMSAAFIQNKDYQSAIDVLKKTNSSKPYILQNLQKSYFMRGIELVDNNSYKNASQYFTEAIQYGAKELSAVTDYAEYWLAECYYRAGDYAKASQQFDNLITNQTIRNSDYYPYIAYNIGYCNLKNGNYQSAITHFNTFINNSNRYTMEGKSKLISEAKTRIADCNFFAKNYVKAAELYESIATADQYKDLYPALQAATSYGLISQNGKKAALLKKITSTASAGSPYYTDALYELGRTLVQESKEEEAEQIFKKILSNTSDNAYLYKALLELGMIASNGQRYSDALAYYKRIVAESPASEETQSALAGIENIYQMEGKSDEFITYIDNLGAKASQSLGDKETLIFNAAEQSVLNKNYASAINSLNSYLQKYPNGGKIEQAYFYLGECYNKTDKKEQAADAYYNVMKKGEGAFSELSTLNYGKLSMELERYDEALKAYQTLEQIAKLENNKRTASIGKMRSQFYLKNYADAIESANKVLSLNGLDKSLNEETLYIRGKSFAATGMHTSAMQDYKNLSSNPKSAFGAEANYELILDAYESGKFANVEKLTFSFSDSSTPQSYWLAKSFIVLGDSYADQNNIEQAKATYTSIIQNYKSSNKDEIIEMAKEKLNKINK